ncbi:MAG TPA: formylglycine-generating enzyme family protein, partial [Planctomycetaceae bacterium]|nr:formylglycine-generating enzyme family protein [Planctomycetaceae bacterium]
RAGTTTKYSFGDSDGRLEVFAWFFGHRQGDYAHQAGLKQANPFGLLDMHGNVWE